MSDLIKNTEGIIKNNKKNFLFLEKNSKKKYNIPIYFVKKVMHNDKVIANIYKKNKKKIAIPKILLKPYLKKFIGKVYIKNNFFIVKPDNFYIKNNILINSCCKKKIFEGDWIFAKMESYPLLNNKKFFSAKIISIISSKTDLFTPWLVILKKYNLNKSEPKIYDYSKYIINDNIHRKDLTNLNFITIDNSNTKDIDDAIYIYKNNKNEFILNIAISDPTIWIKEGSELDSIAKNRGFTNYLPGFNVPMLPKIFSENLCSLKPKKIRQVLVCEVKIYSNGKIDKKPHFFYALIKSKAKLDYENVSNWLENKNTWKPKNNEISKQINLLNCFAKLRMIWRKNNESIFQEKLNYYFLINKFGHINKIIPTYRRIANKMIEEAMIVANICAAKFLYKNLGFGLYNVHNGFNIMFLKKLINILNKNNIIINSCDILSLKGFYKLKKKINDLSTNYLNKLINKFNTSSSIKIHPEPHFGLGLDMYATWTSPIRRYSDIINHRLLNACIFKLKIKKPSNKILKHLITCKKKNKIAQKEIQNWLYAIFLKSSAGKKIYYKSEIIEVIKKGIKVKLIDNGATVFIPKYFINKNYEKIYIDINYGIIKIKKNKYLRQGDIINIIIIKVYINNRLIIGKIYN